jgi:hypothetical protein
VSLRRSQPVTLVEPVSNPTGFDYGPSALRVSTFGNLQQTGTVEETVGAPASGPDTAVSQWLLFLGPSEIIGTFTRVVQGSKVFEVMGLPNLVFRRSRAHHLEVPLRSVDGDGDTLGWLFPSASLYPSVALYPWGG